MIPARSSDAAILTDESCLTVAITDPLGGLAGTGMKLLICADFGVADEIHWSHRGQVRSRRW